MGFMPAQSFHSSSPNLQLHIHCFNCSLFLILTFLSFILLFIPSSNPCSPPKLPFNQRCLKGESGEKKRHWWKDLCMHALSLVLRTRFSFSVPFLWGHGQKSVKFRGNSLLNNSSRGLPPPLTPTPRHPYTHTHTHYHLHIHPPHLWLSPLTLSWPLRGSECKCGGCWMTPFIKKSHYSPTTILKTVQSWMLCT